MHRSRARSTICGGMSAGTNFGDKLVAACREKRSVCCVGLDPVFDQLPGPLKKRAEGLDQPLAAAAEACYVFCCRIIDAVAAVVPVVKLQMACFERLGPSGLSYVSPLVRRARRQELVVILDAKRADIGHTAEGYASSSIGVVETAGRRVPVFDADAVTVNPYFGSDSMKPFLDVCRSSAKGVFILVKTSNPSSAEIQDIETKEGPLYMAVAKLVRKWGQGLVGELGYSSLGAVVGATHPAELKGLRRKLPGVIFLAPGYGAQGGRADDVVGGLDEKGLGTIVTSARGIIYAFSHEPYASTFGEDRFEEAAKQAAVEMNRALRDAASRAGVEIASV